MNILLFGAPGVGKGTQSALLVEKMDMKHISTGDLFRHAIKNETKLGLEAKSFMDGGNLVPDNVVIGMVQEVLEGLDGQNFILDGFPRTKPQAEALESLLEQFGLNIEKVISIQVPDEDLIQRLSGRRVCKDCGAVYHVEAKPTQAEGKCDLCEGEVVQRTDDQLDAIKHRLSVYNDSTRPVKEFYEGLDKLVEIDGAGSADGVFDRIKSILN